jgi:putative restriction endonuclease
VDGIPRSILEKGFDYNGERITLIGPKGIWKPKQMELPLSITTIQNSPYDDGLSDDGFLKYSYRGDNPDHADNVGLRRCMNEQIPIIYFLSVNKGYYIAEWPVYIVSDNMQGLSFTIDMKEDRFEQKANSQVSEETHQYANIERTYRTSQIMVRLHQKTFRERVLQAYHSQCSLCKLKHRELLDAAHIIGDRENKGEPIIQNGISLCKIHHAAFDSNIIGITADYSVSVRKDVLKEVDGPMLKFGIQELNGKGIILPDHQKFWADKDRLSERFERFLKAG